MSHKEQNVLCKESKTPNRFSLTSNNNHNILNASQDRQIWNLKVLRYKSEFVGQQVVRTEQQKQFHCLALRLEKSQTSRGIPISLALYIKHGLCCQTHASDQLRQSDCLTVLVNVYRVSIRSHMTLEQINQPPGRFIRQKRRFLVHQKCSHFAQKLRLEIYLKISVKPLRKWYFLIKELIKIRIKKTRCHRSYPKCWSFKVHKLTL